METKFLIFSTFLLSLTEISAQKETHLSIGIEGGYIATKDHKYISSSVLLNDEYFNDRYHPVTSSYGDHTGTRVSTKFSPGVNLNLSVHDFLIQSFALRFNIFTYISENEHTAPEGTVNVKVFDVFNRYQFSYSLGYGSPFYGKVGLAFSVNTYEYSEIEQYINGKQLGVEPPDNIIDPNGIFGNDDYHPQVKDYNEKISYRKEIETRNKTSISLSILPEIGYCFKQFNIYYSFDWSTFIVPSDAGLYWFGHDYTYRYYGHFLGFRYRLRINGS